MIPENTSTTAIIAFYVRVSYANDIFFGVRTVRVFYSGRRHTVAPWRDVAIVVLTNVKFLTIGLVHKCHNYGFVYRRKAAKSKSYRPIWTA